MTDTISTELEKAQATAKPIAYVRPVKTSQIADAPADAPDGVVYALHDENGKPLALFTDRRLAMAAARSHDYAPVHAH